MGRRKMSWQELRERGCKPSRWMQRKREQEAPLVPEVVEVKTPFVPDPEKVVAYIASIRREWDTFPTRCVDGEIWTRQHGSGFDWKDAGEGYQRHGAIFRFAEGPLRSLIPNLLQQCRDFAEESLADSNCGEWQRELASRFIRDLSTLNEFVFDCEACKNVERMFDTFKAPDVYVPMLRKLAVVEFCSWKSRSTGLPRHDDAELLNFNDQDIVVMDRAFEAQQQAFAVGV